MVLSSDDFRDSASCLELPQPLEYRNCRKVPVPGSSRIFLEIVHCVMIKNKMKINPLSPSLGGGGRTGTAVSSSRNHKPEAHIHVAKALQEDPSILTV